MLKTSIKVKKFWYADIASDGGLGTNWVEVQIGQREGTVQFNGSDADITNYKNILGDTLESAVIKGDMTMNFQLADLSPDVIAAFTGGVVTSDAESNKFDAPENLNVSIEKSIKFLTNKNIEFVMPRVSFDGYPTINDDDLHYYQMNSTVLKPEKTNVPTYSYNELLQPDLKAITSFVLEDETGAAVITGSPTFTVVTEVANGTGLTTLAATIGVSLGASIDPGSDVSTDYTTPVVFTVEAADASTQTWTITVTEAP